jgi:putative transposase
VIAALAGQGYDVKRCCRILAVAPSGYFSWRHRPPSAMELRREWLRGLIGQIHAESRGVYGYRRIRAELRLGRQIVVSRKLVHKLMAEARLKGLPARKQRKSPVNVATADDLVCRDFSREAPNQLWLTDITEHPTREGKVYCCVVLDAHSRRIVGWSIDSHQASSLVTNALAMAISSRIPPAGTVIHSDHGSQFTSWAFSERVRQAGLVPSMGTAVGSRRTTSMWRAATSTGSQVASVTAATVCTVSACRSRSTRTYAPSTGRTSVSNR